MNQWLQGKGIMETFWILFCEPSGETLRIAQTVRIAQSDLVHIREAGDGGANIN